MRGEKRQAKGAKRGPRIQANTRYTRKSGAKTIEHLKKKQYTMNTVAEVVCRQLGFLPYGAEAVSYARFGQVCKALWWGA
jgi:hypothetical protein